MYVNKDKLDKFLTEIVFLFYCKIYLNLNSARKISVVAVFTLQYESYVMNLILPKENLKLSYEGCSTNI